MFSGLNTKLVFTLPTTHWPDCALGSKVSPKRKEMKPPILPICTETQTSLSLLVFERQRQKTFPQLTVRKQRGVYSATGSSGQKKDAKTIKATRMNLIVFGCRNKSYNMVQTSGMLKQV